MSDNEQASEQTAPTTPSAPKAVTSTPRGVVPADPSGDTLPSAPLQANDFFGSHFGNFIKEGRVEESTLASLAKQHRMPLDEARRHYDAYRAQRYDMVQELHTRAGGPDVWREATEWFSGAPDSVFNAQRKAEIAQAIRSTDPLTRNMAVDTLVSAYRQHGGSNTVTGASPVTPGRAASQAATGDMMTMDQLAELSQSNPDAFVAAVERQMSRGFGML